MIWNKIIFGGLGRRGFEAVGLRRDQKVVVPDLDQYLKLRSQIQAADKGGASDG